ncbi:MAG: hypothetical protein AAF639_19830 [Chloroflexota bacterium]
MKSDLIQVVGSVLGGCILGIAGVFFLFQGRITTLESEVKQIPTIQAEIQEYSEQMNSIEQQTNELPSSAISQDMLDSVRVDLSELQQVVETLNVLDDVNSEPQILFYDDFSEDSGVWELGEYDSEHVASNLYLSNGKLRFEVIGKQNDYHHRTAHTGTFSNFVLTADIQIIRSKGESLKYGLIFGKNSQEHYAFNIMESDENYYSINRWDYLTRHWDPITQWSPSKHIRTRGVNILSVSVVGSNLTFKINDEIVSLFETPNIIRGTSAFAVGLENEDEITIDVDNFTIIQSQ